ncbi:helix-turn-helix domain-containing protein [Paenibacillus sp. GCM10027626]|uniref:helix-turn-helix domain-containing protein n=1 Tax=Paenibacillus sp. GCM10027626 TaxID=3273411 RepID=UPI00364275BF
MNAYLSVSEAAAELNITATSIYKIVNHEDENKRLEPVNRTTYKGDGGYRFRREDVERLKPAYIKEDLTSAQAAERLGRSKSFIQKLLKEGLLPYYEGELRGQKTFFIREEHLLDYMASNPDHGKSDTIYDKKSGAFLFQPYRKEQRLARVIEMKRASRQKIEVILQVEGGARLTLEQALGEGWMPALKIKPAKVNSAYGYARFEFPAPTMLDSMIYSIIELFFEQIGPSNMRIMMEDKLIVEVKKSVLTDILPATHPDLLDKLKLFITSGSIIPKFDGTLIDTGLSPITFYLPENKKAALIELADQKGLTLQQWLEAQFA